MGRRHRIGRGIHKLLRLVKRLPVALGLALTTCLLIVISVPSSAANSTPETRIDSSAAVLMSQGKTFYDAGQLLAASRQWQAAVQLYSEQSDVVNQALSLSYLSLAYQDLGEWEKAESSVHQSLQLLQGRRTLDNRGQQALAQVFNTYGSLQLAMGQTENALETWQKSAQYYGQSGDTLGQIGSQINQAQALQTLGLYRRAKITLDTLQETVKTQPDSLLKATILRSLGSIL